jgi:hypothetical protein
MRALYGVFVLAALAATSCKGRNDRGELGALPPPPPLPRVDGGTVAAPAVGAPRGLAAASRALERLPPDRRFLLALDQIDRMIDGQTTSAHAVARSNADGTWSIERTDKAGTTSAVAQVPDSADFEPLMDAVSAYAARRALPAVAAKSSTPKPLPIERVDVPIGHKAFAALAAADQAWKRPSERPLAARHAASALVGILFGTYDKLDIVDELPARAVAAVALARALGAPTAPSVVALLGRILGYGAAGIRLSPETATDAAASYARFDDAALLAVARSSPFGKLAWLRRLALEDDGPAQRAWVDHELAHERLTVPVLALSTLGSAQLEMAGALAAQFPPIALAEAMDASADLAKDSGPAHERAVAALSVKGEGTFEAAAAALGTSRSAFLLAYDKAAAALPAREGPFRDSGLERDYLDTNMVAAMTAVEHYYLGSLGSPTAAAEWVNALAEPAAPRTRAFRTFFAASVGAVSTGKAIDTAAYVTSESPLGAHGRSLILASLASRLERTDGVDVGRGFLARLDSRPGQRTQAAWVNKELIRNARATEAFHRSAAAVTGGAQASVEVDVLRLDRDPEKIIRYARWTAPSAHSRAWLVAWAIAHKIGDRAVLDGIADDLMRQRPLDWRVQGEFVSTYDQLDPARARAIVESWLERKAGAANGGLGDVAARIALARILRRDQKLEEAIHVLEPAAATWQGGGLGELATTHAEAGHPAEAEKLAARRLERYPQSVDAVLGLARVRWMNKDMTGAATAIAKAPQKLSDAQFNYYVGPAFAALFFDKPDQAAAAADALRAAGLPIAADLCGAALLRKKAYATALVVLQPKAIPRAFGVDSQQAKSQYRSTTRELTFEALLGAKGKDEASKWLRAEVGTDGSQFYGVVYDAFRQDKIEVVLDVDPPIVHRADDPASDWTMRLAAQLRRDGHITTADEARKAFAKLPDARYSAYGRYLLGDIDADTVEKLASSPKTTCELAFYLAVRAMADGRHGDAVDLLHVASDTHSTHDAEHIWANDDLDTYSNVTRAFASLAPGLPREP